MLSSIWCAPNSVGINFNTHVVEGCRSQFGAPPNSAGIIFNTRVSEEECYNHKMNTLCGKSSVTNTRCPYVVRVLILIPV